MHSWCQQKRKSFQSKLQFNWRSHNFKEKVNRVKLDFMLPLHHWIFCPCGHHSLRWFLHGAVCIEGLLLVLNPIEWVSELTVIKGNNGLFNPLQQLWGQGLIFIYQLICFDSIVQHLQKQIHPYLLHKIITHTYRNRNASRNGYVNIRVGCNSISLSVYLSDSLALHGERLHLAEVVVVCGHIRDDGLLIRLINIHI